jgi:urease accessory protein
MERDAGMRAERPFVFTNLKTGSGVDRVVDFVTARVGLDRTLKCSLPATRP